MREKRGAVIKQLVTSLVIQNSDDNFSDEIDLSQYGHCTFYIQVTATGSPSVLQIFPQGSPDQTNFADWVTGFWNSILYNSTLGDGEVRAYADKALSKQARLKLAASGTIDTSNYWTINVWAEPFNI